MFRLLYELNRPVPNGMLGGVRGATVSPYSIACLSDIRHSRRPQYFAAGLFLCLQRRKADAEKVISGHKRAVILLDFEKVTSFEIQVFVLI